MDKKYCITVNYETPSKGIVCLFQISEDQKKEQGIVPVAWLCLSGKKGNLLEFSWDPVWSVSCKTYGNARIAVPAVTDRKDADSGDIFTLNYQDYEFELKKSTSSGDQDKISIAIATISTYPKVDVSLCMDAYPISMIEGKSNPDSNRTYKFSIKTKYGLLFGNFQAGKPIDCSTISNTELFEMNNIYSQRCFILQSDNTFKEKDFFVMG
jgi:hypothetical protein